MANNFNDSELNSLSNDFLVSEIQNASLDGKPLSPFEKFMYAYTVVTGSCDTKNNEENFQSVNESEIAPLFEKRIDDKSSQLAELCERLGVLASQISSKKVVKNFVKGRKATGKRSGLLVLLDDNTYDIHGVFYSDPTYDALNPRSASVCHALMNLDEVESLLSKNGKFEFVNPSLSELESQLKLFQTDSDSKASFDELKNKLLNDEVFTNNLKDFIERFMDDVYEMKAKDKSVNKVLHPYFGEGNLPYNDGVSKTIEDAFVALFKMACRSKLSMASKDLPNPARNELMSRYDELDRELADAKRMVKIFSENYEGITPRVFMDTMVEAIYDGDYFAEGSAYAKEYGYVESAMNMLSSFELFEKLKMQKSEGVNQEKIEAALHSILLAGGFSEDKIAEIINEVLFASYLTANEKWNTENVSSSNPFALNAENSQKTKY